MGFFRKRTPGVRAEARILSLGPTARGARHTAARDIEYELRLAVTAPGDSYETEFVTKVPYAKSPLVGDTIPIEVDPEQRAITRIVFGEMPNLEDRARASAAAAQAGDAAGAAEALGFKLRD